jgi:hypothetical protein
MTGWCALTDANGKQLIFKIFSRGWQTWEIEGTKEPSRDISSAPLIK